MTDRLIILFQRHVDHNLTEAEQVEFMGLCLEPTLQPTLQKLVEDVWHTAGEERGISLKEKEEIFRKLFENAVVVGMAPSKNRWKRWMVAASILFMIGLGTYFLWPFNKTGGGLVETPVADVSAPQSNRAMITLANGNKVYMDSAANGQLALQGNIKIVKLANGQIAYETAGGEKLATIQYNTLYNPRGSKVIDMTLADGSRVWLNAGSSVTYPVAFVGNERKVSITGEAYFEVAHNAAMPFKVTKGKTEITVLGTHFNVNAYDDEPDMKITLLEGSVKIVNETRSSDNGQRSTILKPGEQAVLSDNGQLATHTQIDIDAVMAWKNGRFQFSGLSVDQIMRQLSRWYDVEIVYMEKIPPYEFAGDPERQVSISEALKMLEATGKIHFRIEGKKVFVMN